MQSLLGRALSCLRIMGKGERQRETWNDRQTEPGVGKECKRPKEDEKQVRRRREESRGRSLTYPQRRCRGGQTQTARGQEKAKDVGRVKR